MSRSLRRAGLPLIALLGAAVAVLPTLAAGDSTGSVSAKDFYYMPSSVAITPGGTVTFSYGGPTYNHDVHFGGSVPTKCTNNSSTVPSYVGPDSGTTSAPPVTGSNLAWSSTCTFDTEGTYTFYCDVHHFTGTVYVNAAGTVPSATSTTTPPPTTTGTTTVTTPPTTTTTTTTTATGSGGGGVPGAGATTGGGGVGAALGAVALAATQKGPAVRGSADIAHAGSTLTVDLRAASASLARSSGPASAGRLVRRSVGPGRVAFSVPLNARARRAVRRHGRLPVTVKVRVTAPDGTTGIASRRVTVRR